MPPRPALHMNNLSFDTHVFILYVHQFQHNDFGYQKDENLFINMLIIAWKLCELA